MKNRNIPYGYRFENGIIVIDLSEANTLRRIINEYLDGKSLLKIAKNTKPHRVFHKMLKISPNEYLQKGLTNQKAP